MAQGTVKWFSREKGYGFISPDGGCNDLFVHFSRISGTGFKTLEEGAKVSYKAAQGKKGKQQAVNAIPVGEECIACAGSGTCPFCDGTGVAVSGYYRLGCRDCYFWIEDGKEGNGACNLCKGTGRRQPIRPH